MKKRIPTFLAGMLTTAIIGSLGVTALAATNAFTITVDPINIQVNGATFQPKDAQGNAVPVFAYNGTTYAPLRALAEAYGLTVGYDAGQNMATVSGGSGAVMPTAPVATPMPAPVTDANRVPDITVDELKRLFVFDKQSNWGGRDHIYWKYNGEKPYMDFALYWKELNQDDVKIALTIWITEYYTSTYSGGGEIDFILNTKEDGITIDFAAIRYSPSKEISEFYFGWAG